MLFRPIILVLLAASLFGCASHDGTYTPGCMAYAGSVIKLNNGQFVWDKFTDEVILDDAGNVVDQFPGYPLKGSYQIEGQTLFLSPVSGEPLASLYLQQQRERHYLLTAGQLESLGQSGELDECALVLGGFSG
jgi:hypothetical protein